MVLANDEESKNFADTLQNIGVKVSAQVAEKLKIQSRRPYNR